MRAVPRTPAGRAAWVIAAFALLLRCAAAWRWRGEVGDDVDLYRALAAGLLAGDGFADPATGVPTAFRPPLVPLLYAALGNVGPAIVAFQALAGAATAGLTVRLASRLGLAWRFAAGAGLVVACDPVLLRYVARPMTETVCALLAAGLLCRLAAPKPDACVRLRSELLTGVLFGLCCLARPTFWAFGGLLAAGWLWDRLRGRAGWLVGWKTAAAAAVGVACAVGPWAGRNAAVFGRPIVMTTHGGYTLHLANNAVFYGEVVRGSVGAVWGGESLERWQEGERARFLDEVLGASRVDAWGWPVPPLGARGRADQWVDAARSSNLAPGSVGPDWEAEVVGHIPWSERDPDGEKAAAWLLVRPPRTAAEELVRDRWHRDAAVEFIQSDPAGFARAMPLRVSRFWGLAPLGEAAAGLPGAVRWAVGGWNAAVFLLAAWGAWRAVRGRTRPACAAPGVDVDELAGGRPRGPDTRDACGHGHGWRPALLLPVAFTLVHAVYWSNARMRAPVVLAVAALAAAGAAGLLRTRRAAGGREPHGTPAK